MVLTEAEWLGIEGWMARTVRPDAKLMYLPLSGPAGDMAL
jgi:hypothetical protein